jgi:hypothetical protein
VKAEKPTARRFPLRTVRSGWVGEKSASQPLVGDRLRSVLSPGAATSFQHAERITRIDHNDGATTYFLASSATIIASQGARIFWEEQ